MAAAVVAVRRQVRPRARAACRSTSTTRCMAMDNDLGSDQWFEWQKYLLENEPKSPHLVAKTFDGLLEAQGILYNLGHMHPPQAELAGDHRRAAGAAASHDRADVARPRVSRGHRARAASAAATISRPRRCPCAMCPAATYLPYDPENPEEDGLTKAEIVHVQAAGAAAGQLRERHLHDGRPAQGASCC